MFAGYWRHLAGPLTTGDRNTFQVETKQANLMPLEKDGTPVEVKRQEFQNWGGTVKNTPAFTFYPKTVVGVENIVKFAKRHNKRVRVSGFQHTWAPMFSEDNEILIAMLSHAEANDLPVSYPALNNRDELRHIIPFGEEFTDTDGKIKRLFRIGPAVTNQQMRVWANKAFESGKPAYCYPVSVIMEENTLGGMVSNGCHGAGLQNQTVSDNVEAIMVVNAKGEQQIFRRGDPEFASAAIDFGMFGVKVEIIMKLERMPHARMNPKKIPLALTVPPPSDYKMPAVIPAELMKGITREQLQQAEKEFHHRCAHSAYEEEFLFPGQRICWSNAWDEDGKAHESREYPSNCSRKFQAMEEYIAGLANVSLMRMLPPQTQTELLSSFAMLSLPEGPITTTKVNAMHFRGGVQNMRVQDMEFEIGIPHDAKGNLDWQIVQRAWWDAIEIYYQFAARYQFPMRLPLEMRIMGGSNLTMAAQNGNHATCSIEILTIQNGLVDQALWLQFMQAVTDKWTSYTNYRGQPLRVIPHLAKQWEGLTIQRSGEKRMDIETYLREVAFKDAIPKFNRDRESAAKKGGYTLNEMDIFSNRFFDRLMNGKKLEKKAEAVGSEIKDHDLALPKGVTCSKSAERYMRERLRKAQLELNETTASQSQHVNSGTAQTLRRLSEAKNDLHHAQASAEAPAQPSKLAVIHHYGNTAGELRKINIWGSSANDRMIAERMTETLQASPGNGKRK